MSGLEFLKEKKIKWFPINLQIVNGKKELLPLNGNMPSMTDFLTLTGEDCKKLQGVDTEYIAIDTNIIQQLDIDEPTFDINSTDLSYLDKCPYFKSCSKGLNHYFIEYTTTTRALKIGDILHGKWSWARKDFKVFQDKNKILSLKFFDVPRNWLKEPCTEKQMADIIKKLKHRSLNREEWIETCYAIYNVSVSNQSVKQYVDPHFYVHEFSKQCLDKYNDKAGFTLKFINDLKYKWNGLGLGSLNSWLPAKKSKKSKEEEDEKPITQQSVAEELVEKYKNKYMYYQGELYSCNVYGIWSTDTSELFSDIDSLGYDETKTISFYNGTVEYVKKLTGKYKVEFDSNPYLFGFYSGVYDLKNDLFRVARPEEYVQKSVPYIYSERKTDKIEKILKDIFTEDIYEYQINYLCTGIIGELLTQTFQFWIGSGSNGKSFLLNLLGLALGPYYYAPSNALLGGSEEKLNEPNPAKLKLKNIRLASFTELRTLDRDTAKKLTGEDPLSGRLLHSNEVVSFSSVATIIISVQNPPSVEEVDSGFIRRVQCIPMLRSFVNDPDPSKPDQIKLVTYTNEEKLELGRDLIYLLIKSFKGYRRDLEVPLSIKNKTEYYLSVADPFLNFIKNNIEEGGLLQKKDIKNCLLKEGGMCGLYKKDYNTLIKKIEVKYGSFSRSKKINYKLYHDVIEGISLITDIEDTVESVPDNNF